MKILFTVFLFVLTLKSTAQDNLHMLFSHAPLPAWVNQDPEKYHSAILAQWKAAGIKMNKDGENQLHESTLVQYDYLSSGRLLFNDEAGVLLNRLADSLLRTQPEIRKQLKIYAYYSAGTNAMCFPNGLIIIELGLIAQMENEDQLAFVLSHEISHFMDGHYSTQEIAIQPDHTTDKIDAYLKFRREEENATDLDAFDLYKKAKFSVMQALRAFDIMERNWMVPEALAFDVSFFENSSFYYPSEPYHQVTDITPGYPDSDFNNATHESFQIRKAKVAEFYKLDTNAVKYQKASADFDRLNKLVIYNCGLIELEENHFAAAIYAGYYLHAIDSANWEASYFLIDKTIYQYAASKSTPKNPDPPLTTSLDYEEKMDNIFSWNTPSKKVPDIRGYISDANHFLQSLTLQEIMLLSLSWSWKYYETTQKYKSIAEKICSNSVEMYSYEFGISGDDSLGNIPIFTTTLSYSIETEPSAITPLPNPGVSSIKLKSDNSYKRNSQDSYKTTGEEAIKLSGKQYNQKSTTSVKYTSTQLKNCLNDTSFTRFYKTHFLTHESLDKKLHQTPVNAAIDSMYLIGSPHIWMKENKREWTFRTYKFHVNEKMTARKSKEHLIEFQSIAKSNKINLIHETPLFPDSLTLDLYNDICLARRVFSEIVAPEDDKYFAMPLAYASEFDSVSRVNNVPYGVIDISVTKQFKKVDDPLTYGFCMLILPATPFLLLYLAFPHDFTYRQTSIYDLRTGKIYHTWVRTSKEQSSGNRSSNYYHYVFHPTQKPVDKWGSTIYK